MMMPANFSAVNAEVVYGGAVADYLPNAWTAANVKTLSTNVLTILSNSFTKLLVGATLGTMFSGNWGDDGVKLFGDTGTNIIGTRHGEKLFETLMTREERLRSQDMGHYFRVAADNRDLNYDKFVVNGEVHTMADESYTSHNTTRLDVEGTVKKILTTEYVQNALKGIPNV